MDRERILNQLRKKAEERARLDNKSNKIWIVAVLFLILTGVLIIQFNSNFKDVEYFFDEIAITVVFVLIILIFWSPFKSVSKEEFEKHLKEMITQRIEDLEYDLTDLKKRHKQTIEELKILKEINNV